MANYLSLEFDIGTAVLQYHPNSLSLSQRSNSSSVIGLENIITQIARPETTNYSISFSSTITALDSLNKSENIDKAAYTGLAAVGVGALGATDIGVDLIGAATNTISLAKGILDLTTGLISSLSQAKKTIPFNTSQLNNISLLRKANRETLPCKINWDIEQSTRKEEQRYFVQDLGIDVRSIQEETGVTVAFELGILLSQYGETVVAF